MNGNYLKRLLKKKIDLKDYSLSNNNIADDFRVFLSKITYSKLSELMSIYPDYRYRDLLCLLEKTFKVDGIVLGSGSEDLIMRINACLDSGGPIGILVPNFYRIIETIRNKKIKKINISYDLNSEYLDVNQIIKQIKGIKSLWITNPNPMIGKIFKKNDLIKLIKDYPKILFIVDESAIDFVKDINKFSLLRFSQHTSNLIVIKSFSKLYGLAGLRVGFAVGNSKILREVKKIGLTFPVNKIAEYLLIILLKEKTIFTKIRDGVERNKLIIEKIISRNKNIIINKSITNCIFISCRKKNTFNELLRAGIISLKLDGQEGIKYKNFVRLTIHSSKYLQKDLVNRIRQFLELQKK
jgi:histidinol-phosphate/aromatic aminotransferase/cobyric acid decarboxylase-like protein